MALETIATPAPFGNNLPGDTEKRDRYETLVKTVHALCEGESDEIALMATVTCEVYHAFDHFHWVGFYRNIGNETLKIGPYQGGHGCLVIPFSKGVCGKAARTGITQIVDDVNSIPDHIACSASTRSEIVLPVWHGGELIGVFDLDSDFPAAFTETDKEMLLQILQTAFGSQS